MYICGFIYIYIYLHLNIYVCIDDHRKIHLYMNINIYKSIFTKHSTHEFRIPCLNIVLARFEWDSKLAIYWGFFCHKKGFLQKETSEF